MPRLYDLVKVREEKVRMAFYYGLGNTLVAKDLDQATRIALQGNVRHRVVTLQGQLIEQSGGYLCEVWCLSRLILGQAF